MKNKKISLYFKVENPNEYYIVECLERMCKDELSSYNAVIKRILKSAVERRYGVQKQKWLPERSEIWVMFERIKMKIPTFSPPE